MLYGAAESWNLRDKHMAETLELLLAAKGWRTACCTKRKGLCSRAVIVWLPATNLLES